MHKNKITKALGVLAAEAEQLEALADAEFAQYQFGDGVTVSESDNWDRNDAADFTKIVYITCDDDAPDADSERVSFHVRFKADGSVDDAYGLLMRNGSEIGSRPTKQEDQKMDSLAILGVLAEVQGPCSVNEGVLWLEDGTSLDVGAASKSRAEYLTELRLAGYAVVIFSPDELGTASAKSLENRLVELGNEAISDLQDSVPSESPKG